MILAVNARDNVAVALRDLDKDERTQAGERVVRVKGPVPFGHKVSLTDIQKGDRIIKYGEVIGVATEHIEAGCHVHTHNMAGLRGRGDERV